MTRHTTHAARPSGQLGAKISSQGHGDNRPEGASGTFEKGWLMSSWPTRIAPEALQATWPEQRQRLAERRKELGLSPGALGKLMRKHSSVVSSYEDGRTAPWPASLARWLTALGLKELPQISPPGATGPSTGVDDQPPLKATSARVGRTKPKGAAPEAAPLAAATIEICAIHGCAHRAYTSHVYLCRGAPCECATLKICLVCAQERLRVRYDAKPEGVVRG